MNIFYCGDKNIETGLALSVMSLSKNTDQPLNIFVFTLNYHENGYDIFPIRNEVVAILERYLREYNAGSSVRLFDCTQFFRMEIPQANMDTRFTPCCMLRLYADFIPDIPDRVLYLDYDVLCRADFSDFYNQDMEGVEIAGSPDYYGQWVYSRPIWGRNYLNSGVLLMNMEEIRRSGLMRRCREMCEEKLMFLPDQHAINRQCKSKRVCDRRYNEQRMLHSDTVFQHFSTTFRLLPYPQVVNVKPWNVEQLHKKLRLFDYDNLLIEFQQLKEKITK